MDGDGAADGTLERDMRRLSRSTAPLGEGGRLASGPGQDASSNEDASSNQDAASNSGRDGGAQEPAFADLGPRVGSAIALSIGGAAAIWFGGLVFALCVGAGAAVMAWELRRITSGASPDPAALTFPAVAAAAALLAHLGGDLMWGLGPAAVAALILALRDQAAGRDGRWSGPGLALIAAAAAGAVSLRDAPEAGAAAVFGLALVVAAADIGGYFAGRLVGGPKMLPRLSPRKTWSGLAGGVALAAVIGVLYGVFVFGTAAPVAACVAVVIAVVALAGDLVESALKRRFGVKDSGRLIPGHGGALDRLDGVAAAMVIAAVLAAVVGGPG